MKTVYKYPLIFDRDNVFSLPVGARPAMVGSQGDQVCVWMEIDTTGPYEFRTFKIYGTGFVIPAEETFVGSCLTHDGFLVWHVYER